MAKEFNEEISQGQPSIRIGNIVPDESVNLGFVDAPSLNPLDNIQVFDYSARIPENSTSVEHFNKLLFVNSNRELVNENNDSRIPINNILLTNKFKTLEGNRMEPLFYKYQTRFLHYEKGASGLIKNGEYVGKGIVVMDENGKTNEPYTIELASTNVDDTYIVNIYSNFTSSASKYYKVKYNKVDKTSSRVFTDFAESYNPSSIFNNLGSSQEAISTVQQSQIGDNIFATELVSENKYKIWVADESISWNLRYPIIFRWRILRSDGFMTNWRQERLFAKDSLHDIEWTDHDGDPLYFDAGGVAKKLILSSPLAAFPNQKTGSTYSIEKEIWCETEKKWIVDSSNKIICENFPSNGIGNVYVYTNEDTGPSISSASKSSIEYQTSVVPITIEGYAVNSYEVPTTPEIESDVALLSAGAEISATGLEKYRFLGTNASTTPKDVALKALISGPSLIQQIGANLCIANLRALWTSLLSKKNMISLRSEEKPVPPKDKVSIRLTLPEEKSLKTVAVAMGDKGRLDSLSIENESGLVTKVLTKDLLERPGRIFEWDLSEGMPAVKHIVANFSPSVWKARDYFWLLNLVGIKDLYQSGMDIVSISAIHYSPGGSDLDKWSKVASYNLSVSKNERFSEKFSDIVSQLGLGRPGNIPQGIEVRYRAIIGDAINSNYEKYSPLLTINFRNGNNGYYFPSRISDITASDMNSKEVNIYDQDLIDISESDLDNAYLQCRVDDYDLSLARYYYASTYGDNNIFIKQPEQKSIDEMWFPKINNGRFVIQDNKNNQFKEYIVKEFGTQAFSDRFAHDKEKLNPYSESIFEKASFLDNNRISVLNTPLFVNQQNGEPDRNYLAVYPESEKDKPLQDRYLLPIRDWNVFTGEIQLNTIIKHTDKIYVDYVYEITDYEYKGYVDADNDKFYYLDLNPMPGHKYTDLKTGNLLSSKDLLHKDIYLYIMPSYVLNFNEESGADTEESLSSNYIKSNSGSSLRHIIVDEGSLEQDVLSLISQEDPDARLLGKILVRNTYSPSMISITDTRSLGGGFKEGISLDFIRSISPEAEFSWDIGSWDGQPYPSNGVIVVTVPDAVLKTKDNPKGFTEEEVREIVQKYIAFGVYPIIRYKKM